MPEISESTLVQTSSGSSEINKGVRIRALVKKALRRNAQPPQREKSSLYSEVAMANRTGHRGLEYYKKAFCYTPETDLPGKSILDVGSGDSTFAEEAAKFGAKVARVDAKYRPQKDESERDSFEPYDDELGAPKDVTNAVAGDVQKLPFKDDAFDETIASFSFLKVRESETSLKEMLRVTKPGGVVKIHPVYYIDYTILDDVELPLGAKLINNDKSTIEIPKEAGLDSETLTQQIDQLLKKIAFRTGRNYGKK